MLFFCQLSLDSALYKRKTLSQCVDAFVFLTLFIPRYSTLGCSFCFCRQLFGPLAHKTDRFTSNRFYSLSFLHFFFAFVLLWSSTCIAMIPIKIRTASVAFTDRLLYTCISHNLIQNTFIYLWLSLFLLKKRKKRWEHADDIWCIVMVRKNCNWLARVARDVTQIMWTFCEYNEQHTDEHVKLRTIFLQFC